MELVMLMLWLCTGAVIGWFANRMVSFERNWERKPTQVRLPALKSAKHAKEESDVSHW